METLYRYVELREEIRSSPPRQITPELLKTLRELWKQLTKKQKILATTPGIWRE